MVECPLTACTSSTHHLREFLPPLMGHVCCHNKRSCCNNCPRCSPHKNGTCNYLGSLPHIFCIVFSALYQFRPSFSSLCILLWDKIPRQNGDEYWLLNSYTLSLQKLQNTKDGTRLQRPQCASTQTRGEREFAIDYNVIGLHWKLTVFNSQAKKKGITWIKPSYLRKIDFVAVLESADSLAEAGSRFLNLEQCLSGMFCSGGQLMSFPSEISGMTISKLKVLLEFSKCGQHQYLYTEGGTGCDEG